MILNDRSNIVADYTVWLDKNTLFECSVDVKNASLKNSTSRIILETDDISYVFSGTIKDGKCNIPIRKMKGMLPENTKGTMKLEIIVEDVYFAPWSSPFVVDTDKQMVVKVMEQTQTQVEKKPIITVKEVVIPKNKSSLIKNSTEIATNDLKNILKEYKITKLNVNKQKKHIKEIFNSYFSEHSDLKDKRHIILTNVIKSL